MNATAPISHASPISDAAQANAPASGASANSRAGSQDFAAALNDTGGKPPRKNVAHKQDPASSGSSLPAPGNPPPSATTTPQPAKADDSGAAVSATATPATPSASAPDAADAAAPVKASASGAQGSDPGASAPVSIVKTNSAAVTASVAPEMLDPAALPQTVAAGADLTTAANDPAGPGIVPSAAGIRTLATATSIPKALPAASAGDARTAKLSEAAALQGTSASDTSASSADGNATSGDSISNGPAAAGTDANANAQAAMAAALAQSNAASPASSSSDDAAVSDTSVAQYAAVLGAAGAGNAAAGDPAAGDPATALARASAAATAAAATAAATAATAAASVAQGFIAAANAGAADKRPHGNTPDASISGASNDGSVGAAQLLTSNTSADGAPTPTFKVAAGVDTAQFGQGIADRVSMMMDGNLTSAKLQLNPPALGPIEVRIALQGGHAQVSFSSHSAVTRDALESSSAKLREMLGSQGFSQVSVDISHRSFQERSPQSQAYDSAPAISADAAVMAEASISMPRSASALLDAYA